MTSVLTSSPKHHAFPMIVSRPLSEDRSVEIMIKSSARRCPRHRARAREIRLAVPVTHAPSEIPVGRRYANVVRCEHPLVDAAAGAAARLVDDCASFREHPQVSPVEGLLENGP